MDEHQDLTGIWFLLLGIFCLVSMDAFVKLLVENNIFALQTLAIRSLFAIPALIFIHKTSIRNYQKKSSTKAIIPSITSTFFAQPLLIIRGVLGILAPFCFFSSLRYLSLPDATVIFFASTFGAVILSIFVLKEKVGIHRWTALITGFIGVFIAINPQVEGDIKGYALVLFAAFISACIVVSGRILTKTHRVSIVVLGLNIGMSIPALCLLPWFWNDMTADSILLVFAVAICAVCGHLMVTTAFSKTPASILAPFDYSALPWSILIGYFVWQDLPDLRLIIGATIIIASGVFVAHRERKANEQFKANQKNSLILTARTK